MAQSQQPERGGEAEFVRRIVTDPRNVPDVMRLYGYPGASSEENHDRLYLNPDLSQYVEVPRNAILHRMTVPTEQDPNGAIVLWVRRDAALIQKAAPAAQALAQYFAGAIAGAAGGAAMPALHFCVPTQIIPCTVTCPATPAAPCLTHVLTQCLPCPTHQLTPCLPCLTQQVTPCPPCPTHQLTPCLPCATHQVTCAPAFCPVSLPAPCPGTQPAVCQVTGVQCPSIGAVCGPQGSIACGISAVCGVGVGQVGAAADAMAAASPHTLCAAGGVLCTPDCPTYPQRCGVTPICQVTAVCQPTRETPCFATQGCVVATQGCGGGGTLHVPCTAHPCVPFVPALAAAAPQAAAFGYGTVACWPPTVHGCTYYCNSVPAQGCIGGGVA